jgi:hypothetical protein
LLTSALAAKGKAEAVSLAVQLPFALATNDRKEVAKILADFESKDSRGRSVVVLDKNLSEVAASGAATSNWISVRDNIRSIASATSWSQERFVVSAAVTAAANRIRDVSDGLHQNADRLSKFSNGLPSLVATFKF